MAWKIPPWASRIAREQEVDQLLYKIEANKRKRLTRRHVKAAPTSEITRHRLRSGQSKVRNLHHPSLPNKDILRLQIPMINPLRMASLHRLYDLQERPRDERVVVDVSALLNDAGEEVAAVAVLEDDVYES
jgi:hypothetical protein